MNLDKKVLQLMFDELELAPEIYTPSNFWKQINKSHILLIGKTNIKNFKRTVNMKYFNWGILGIIRHQMSPILSEMAKINFSPIVTSRYLDNKKKNSKNLNWISGLIYKIYIAFLYDYISRYDELNLFEKITEPRIGNPILVNYKEKTLSQDLCNSINEFYSINQSISLPEKARIVEIGAGYGRLAYIFLKVLPKSSYCIVDIPPALYIAQEYLAKVFPNEKIFRFRPFKHYKDIKKEFESSRIQFILPHQLEYLPKHIFNITINISSLHEMNRDQINNYIKQIGIHSKGYFYTKQWKKSRTKDNNFIKENEYPIPKQWKVIFKRQHPIQSMFFEQLYQVK